MVIIDCYKVLAISKAATEKDMKKRLSRIS